MSQSIHLKCSACNHYNQFTLETIQKLSCENCQKELGEIKNPNDIFDYCPICSTRQFYLMKNFNQMVGCTVMLCGIILVPFTYGLSLPVFALIDWILYKKVPAIIVCYRCGCEFHGFKEEERRFKPFMHHIGLKYDKYR